MRRGIIPATYVVVQQYKMHTFYDINIRLYTSTLRRRYLRKKKANYRTHVSHS